MSIWSVPSRFRLSSAACNTQRRDSPPRLGSSPMGLASLVASTQLCRLLEMARPTTCSELPPEYASAVSMKLMPASRALATIRVEVASSVGPPNIMVPRHIGEIFRPLRPRLRYCIGWILCVAVIICCRHCERSEAIHSAARKYGLLRRFAPLHKRFAFVAGNDGGVSLN